MLKVGMIVKFRYPLPHNNIIGIVLCLDDFWVTIGDSDIESDFISYHYGWGKYKNSINKYSIDKSFDIMS